MNRMKRFFHLDLLTYLHLITIVMTIQIAFTKIYLEKDVTAAESVTLFS